MHAATLGHAVHREKDATLKTLDTMCNAYAWPLQCWKSCANGSNIVAFHFSDQLTEQKKCWELLAQNFDRFQTLHNNCQQHATTRNIQQCWIHLNWALHRKIRFCRPLNSYLARYLSIWACGTKSIKSRPSLILRSISYFSRPLTYSKRNIRNITATKYLHI